MIDEVIELICAVGRRWWKVAIDKRHLKGARDLGDVVETSGSEGRSQPTMTDLELLTDGEKVFVR